MHGFYKRETSTHIKKTLVGATCFVLIVVAILHIQRSRSNTNNSALSPTPEARLIRSVSTSDMSVGTTERPIQENIVPGNNESRLHDSDDKSVQDLPTLEDSTDAQLEPDNTDSLDNPASVSGVVLDEYGAPISGAEVILTATGAADADATERYANKKHHFSATSNAEGEYEIDGIAYSGMAAIRALADGHAGGRKIQIEGGATLTNVDIVVFSGPTLTGRVLSPDTDPVTDAVVNVMAFAADTGRAVESVGDGNLAYTDNDGVFQLGFKENGLAALQITTPDYPSELFTDVLIGSPEIVEFHLSRPASLKGHIRWGSGEPAAGVSVTVSRKALQTSGPDAIGPAKCQIFGAASGAIVNDDGYYVISAIAPGAEFKITINENGQQFLDENLGALSPGEKRVWDRTIDDLAVIHGRIYESTTRQPLANARYSWRKKDATESVCTSFVSKDGSFKEEVAPGTYVFTPTYVGEFGVNEWTKEITCSSGETYTLDLFLPASATLPIVVLDDQGEPVRGAAIKQMTRSSNDIIQIIRDGVTDTEGRFVWTGITPNTDVWMSVTKEGYAHADTSKHVAGPGQTLPEETIVLRGDCGIEGIAVDREGQLLRHIGINIRAESEDSTQQLASYMRTDQDGHFFLAEGIPASASATITFAIAVSSHEQALTATVGPIACTAGQVMDLGRVQFAPEN